MRTATIVCSALFAAMTAQVRPPTRIELPRGFRPTAMAAADFDHDGNIDVAIAGIGGQLIVLMGDGHGGLHLRNERTPCGPNAADMIAIDIDGDGKIDLAIPNHETNYLTLLMGDGHGRFTPRTVHVHSNPHPHTVAVADVDGDGRRDLITDSWAEKRLTLVRAGPNGTWQSPGTPIDVGRTPYRNVIAADLDGDGHVDLVMPNYGFDTVSIFFGDGHGHFAAAPQSPIAAGPAPFTIVVADVNADGRPDIVVGNYSGTLADTTRDGVTWIRNDGRRHFTAFATPMARATAPTRMAVGDVNGDGIADVALANYGSSEITLILGSRSGPHPGGTVAVMPRPHAIALADLDHDGRADLLVTTEDEDALLVVRSIR